MMCPNPIKTGLAPGDWRDQHVFGYMNVSCATCKHYYLLATELYGDAPVQSHYQKMVEDAYWTVNITPEDVEEAKTSLVSLLANLRGEVDEAEV